MLNRYEYLLPDSIDIIGTELDAKYFQVIRKREKKIWLILN